MSKTPPETEETSGPAAVLREAGSRAREGLEQARRKGREGVEQARRKAADAVSATREKGEAALEDTREKTLRAAAETNRLFQEHPIAAVAAAAAAGAVLGIFLPRFNITNRAGRVAGRAIKAAIAAEATQLLVAGASEAVRASDTDETPLLPPGETREG